MLCCTFRMFGRGQKQDSGTVVFWLCVHHKGLISSALCLSTHFQKSGASEKKKRKENDRFFCPSWGKIVSKHLVKRLPNIGPIKDRGKQEVGDNKATCQI